CAASEYDGLRERVPGHPVRAVYAGRGALAGGEQPRDRGSTVDVGRDAAEEVVRGRGDRNGFTREIEPALANGLRHVREAPFDLLRADGTCVEERLDAFRDRSRHDVARRELPVRVYVEQEP